MLALVVPLAVAEPADPSWMARTATFTQADIVVTIGWTNHHGALVYATLSSDRHDINPAEPKGTN